MVSADEADYAAKHHYAGRYHTVPPDPDLIPTWQAIMGVVAAYMALAAWGMDHWGQKADEHKD